MYGSSSRRASSTANVDFPEPEMPFTLTRFTRARRRAERKPVRRRERPEPPSLVRPDVLGVRGRAAPAVDAALAEARPLALLRRPELARPQRALERPLLPLLDGRHPQRVLRAGVE